MENPQVQAYHALINIIGSPEFVPDVLLIEVLALQNAAKGIGISQENVSGLVEEVAKKTNRTPSEVRVSLMKLLMAALFG